MNDRLQQKGKKIIVKLVDRERRSSGRVAVKFNGKRIDRHVRTTHAPITNASSSGKCVKTFRTVRTLEIGISGEKSGIYECVKCCIHSTVLPETDG
ncbi:hypothetical protein KPH14_004076 [Odynerus spinipes]|uniref:Uncharacterized protein n=1 Tax=Odynerus spinipes TaxID=1348599 RepID=A0AAD9RXX8_9HYME|nr:hypothetical protein KPH14_004076 [Odynerus spinipes]